MTNINKKTLLDLAQRGETTFLESTNLQENLASTQTSVNTTNLQKKQQISGNIKLSRSRETSPGMVSSMATNSTFTTTAMPTVNSNSSSSSTSSKVEVLSTTAALNTAYVQDKSQGNNVSSTTGGSGVSADVSGSTQHTTSSSSSSVTKEITVKPVNNISTSLATIDISTGITSFTNHKSSTEAELLQTDNIPSVTDVQPDGYDVGLNVGEGATVRTDDVTGPGVDGNGNSGAAGNPTGTAIATICAATDAMQVRFDSTTTSNNSSSGNSGATTNHNHQNHTALTTAPSTTLTQNQQTEQRARELLSASTLLHAGTAGPTPLNAPSSAPSTSLSVIQDTPLKGGGSSMESVSSSSSKSTGKGTDKKKKGTSWYNMLSPTYKSRSDEFRRYFKDIPANDRLIVDYSCALQKDILVHGRIYISQHHVSFYANIFRWETVVTIKCKDIITLTKERTARVIPNAIQIVTQNEKYFFTTFGTRDKTYLMLFRVWQNARLEQLMSPQELWQWVHYNYGEDLGLTDGDDDYTPPTQEDELQFKTQLEMVESGNFEVGSPGSNDIKVTQDEDVMLLGDVQVLINDPGCTTTGGVTETSSSSASIATSATTTNTTSSSNNNNAGSVKREKGTLEEKDENTVDDSSNNSEGQHTTRTTGVPTILYLPNTQSGTVSPSELLTDVESSDDNIVENLCSGHNHYPIISLDEVFHLSCDQIYQLLFTNSDFLQRFNNTRKTSDLLMTDWPSEVDSDGNKSRIIQYNLSITFSLGTKLSYTTEKQTLYEYNSNGATIMLDTEVNNAGIPYADSFYVINRYCINRVSNRKCRLKITNEIKYKKNVWGLVKNFIEKNTTAGVVDHFTMLAESLRRECSENRSVVAPSGVSVGNTQGTTSERKKVLRKRRTTSQTAGGNTTTTGQASSTVHSTTAAHGATHTTNHKGGLSHEDLPFNLNMDSLVRIVCTVLIFLIVFNAMLFYKLFVIENRAKTNQYMGSDYVTGIKNEPTSLQDWANLLEQQQHLHDLEIDRWKDVLEATVTVMDQMKVTLVDLQDSIDKRSKFMADLRVKQGDRGGGAGAVPTGGGDGGMAGGGGGDT